MFFGVKCNNSAGAPSPRIPVRLGGDNELHAAFLTESRTRNHVWGRAVGIPGSLPVFSGQGWDTTNLDAHCRGIPPFAKNAKDGAPVVPRRHHIAATTTSPTLITLERGRS